MPVFTKNDGQCMLTKVKPFQSTGTRGFGHCDHLIVIILNVGDHGELVLATR